MESHCALSIPLHDEKKTEQLDSYRSSSGRHWPRSAGMFSGQRSLGSILVVDDDPAIRKLLVLLLEKSGYDVLVAEDGEDAINLVGSGENPMVVDTIIADLSMSNIDGVDAIAYFQKEFPSIPLIVLTGNADWNMAISFMRRGVSDYLVKPVEGEQVTAAVAGAIAQRQFSLAKEGFQEDAVS
jgi:two-component system chemotaxis response regulator CheY